MYFYPHACRLIVSWRVSSPPALACQACENQSSMLPSLHSQKLTILGVDALCNAGDCSPGPLTARTCVQDLADGREGGRSTACATPLPRAALQPVAAGADVGVGVGGQDTGAVKTFGRKSVIHSQTPACLPLVGGGGGSSRMSEEVIDDTKDGGRAGRAGVATPGSLGGECTALIPVPEVECGGMWWNGAECGGMWWNVAECGGMWRNVAECGGMWRNVVECGGMWRNVVEGGGRWWGARCCGC